MDEQAKRIAVVQGAPSPGIQTMFGDLVESWRPDVRVAGVIEEGHGLAGRGCRAGYLRRIADGTRFAIFEDLGPGAEACHLDGRGAVGAAEAVKSDIAAGCDLVLLSKFGKLESGRGGLTAAFEAAIAADRPILTSVSPEFEPAWAAFAAPLFVVLPADPQRIAAWWRAVRADDLAQSAAG
jgi:hypothetical protein